MYAAYRTLAWSTAITLFGCSPAVDSARFAVALPKPPGHQILFYSTKVPTCAYEELGLVSVKGGQSMDVMLAAAQERARQMGGDAIVSVRELPYVSGNAELVSTSESISGTVIRFKDQGCRQ